MLNAKEILVNNAKREMMAAIFTVDNKTREMEIFNAYGYFKLTVKPSFSIKQETEYDLMVYAVNDTVILNLQVRQQDKTLADKNFTSITELIEFFKKMVMSL